MELEEIEEIAKKIMKKNKEHSPQLIIERKDPIRVECLLLLCEEETKEEMLKVLRLLINNGSVDRYFLITDAWKSEDIYSQPSKAKDKTEVLIIYEFRRDMKNRCVMIDYVRKRNNIYFTTRKEVTQKDGGMTSRFNFFLEDAMGEIIEKARIDSSLSKVDDKLVKTLTEKARKALKVNITEEQVKSTVINMVKSGRFRLRSDKEKEKVL